jgi:transcriptional regulator with GAF, ATPase, and Fis domain
MESLRLNEQTEQALAESQRRSRVLATINSVAEATASLTNITDLLETVRLQLAQVMPVNSFTVATYNKAETSLYYEYGYDDKYGKLDDSSPFPLEPYHLSYKSIMEAVPQIIHYTPEEVEEQTRNRPPNMIDEDSTITASLLFVPQLSGEDVVGIISVQSYQFNAYTQDDVNLLISVGGYVTTALQKARLFEQTQTRAEELAVINQVAQTVSQQIDQYDLLVAVYEQIRRILPVDAYLVALYDHQNNLIEYPLIVDDGRFYQNPPSTPSTTSKVFETIRTGQPTLINRSLEEMEAFSKAHPGGMVGDEQKPSASLIYVPLRIGDETLGVLSVQSYRLNAYTEANITLLSGIANHVAVALDNARLLQTTQNTARREQLLREISTNIQSTVDAESVLQTAAREIGRALGLETYVYLTPDTNGDA